MMVMDYVVIGHVMVVMHGGLHRLGHSGRGLNPSGSGMNLE
jgi:hypothetical protein